MALVFESFLWLRIDRLWRVLGPDDVRTENKLDS